VYFEIQRIAGLIKEAATPRPTRFDPRPRLAQELRRILDSIPSESIPETLRAALLSGEAVGDEADHWLPHVRRWLADECARTGV
jgi:hypothetical protein